MAVLAPNESAKPTSNNCTQPVEEIPLPGRAEVREGAAELIFSQTKSSLYIHFNTVVQCEILLMLTPITKTYIVSFSVCISQFTSTLAGCMKRKVNG